MNFVAQLKWLCLISLLLQLNGCTSLSDETVNPSTTANTSNATVSGNRIPNGSNFPSGTSPIKTGIGEKGNVNKSTGAFSSGQLNQAEVIRSLLTTAKKQRENKQFSNATATLDRAVRIAPKDPEPFKQLAEVRFEQGKYAEAEQMSRKALVLAGTQGRPGQRSYSSDYLADLWDIVAESRSRLGDRAGAIKARENAAELRAN